MTDTTTWSEGGRPAARGGLRAVTVGKAVMSCCAVWAGVGPFLYTWNESHIFNPAWSPHAKFHNAHTMSLGLGLAASTLLQLWRPEENAPQARTALDGAAVSAVLFWATQATSLLFPGARAVDPPATGLFPQARYAAPAVAGVAVGYLLERRRLSEE